MSTDNIFGLNDPTSYRCSVKGYTSAHSELYIEASSTDSNLYLAFTDVQYICIPRHWVGANFKILESKLCLELLRLVSSLDSLSDDILLKTYHLYALNTSTSSIKIVAASARILEAFSGNFSLA